MCGLIGFISNSKKETQAGRKIINQYQNQWKRGTSGFGVIEIFEKGFQLYRATEPTKALLDARESKAPIMLFHHRTPTSTENTLEQTHPIVVTNKELNFDYLIMHNGVISNHEKLFEEHKKAGYDYTTLEVSQEITYYHQYARLNQKYNDTESLAIELARYLDDKKDTVDIEGSAAFLGLIVDKKTQKPMSIFWGRNETSPIKTLLTQSGLLLASQIPYEGSELTPQHMYYDFNLKEYFKKANEPLASFITEHELPKPKEKPKEIPTSTTYLPSSTSYNLSEQTLGKVITLENEFANKSDDIPHLTSREQAFAKVSSRLNKKFKEQLDKLFQSIAYDDIGMFPFEHLIHWLRKEFEDKVERSGHIRTMFDKLEFEEYSKPTIDDEDIIQPNEKEYDKAGFHV